MVPTIQSFLLHCCDKVVLRLIQRLMRLSMCNKVVIMCETEATSDLRPSDTGEHIVVSKLS